STRGEAPSMATRTKPRPAPAFPLAELPPQTTEERLRAIEAMGERINEYIAFMCKVGELHGTSAEAKEKAVATFHECMASLERQLGRIQEELRLGGATPTSPAEGGEGHACRGQNAASRPDPAP